MPTLLRLRPATETKTQTIDMFQAAASREVDPFGPESASLAAPRVNTFRVVCLICKRADPAAPLAVPLCGLCVEDLDKAQAHVDSLKDAALARHAAGLAVWEAALRGSDAATVAWWARVSDLLDFADVARANAIMDKAAGLGGRAAPLVAAWRAWGRECARCAELLLRADHIQRAVNTARLAEAAVL